MREKLLEKIELLREQMVTLGLEYGLNHPEVLLYSQKIDELHNRLMEVESRSKVKNQSKTYRFGVLEKRANFA